MAIGPIGWAMSQSIASSRDSGTPPATRFARASSHSPSQLKASKARRLRGVMARMYASVPSAAAAAEVRAIRRTPGRSRTMNGTTRKAATIATSSEISCRPNGPTKDGSRMAWAMDPTSREPGCPARASIRGSVGGGSPRSDEDDAGGERDRAEGEQAERLERRVRDIAREHHGRDQAIQDRPWQRRTGEQPAGRPASAGAPPSDDERGHHEDQRQPEDDPHVDEQERPEHQAAGERDDRRSQRADGASGAHGERADDNRHEERHRREEDGERDGDFDRGLKCTDVHGPRRYRMPVLCQHRRAPRIWA